MLAVSREVIFGEFEEVWVRRMDIVSGQGSWLGWLPSPEGQWPTTNTQTCDPCEAWLPPAEPE